MTIDNMNGVEALSTGVNDEGALKRGKHLLTIIFLCVFTLLFSKGADAAMRWGNFRADSCKGMGVRQYSAILWDISWGSSWEAACASMSANINGHHFNSPTRCVNTGGNMWGEFDVPDNSCPHWGEFNREACSIIGKRQYSAILHDVPTGISWENACASEGAYIEAKFFPAPARCVNTGLAMWGQFDVDDVSCRPSWGSFQKDHCTAPDKRQYSAVLHNIPSGISWEDACKQTSATINGTYFASPARCKNTGLAMWGEFDVNDATCTPPTWGAFQKGQCTASGKRQYSAVLHNIPQGASWEDACKQTSANINGTYFASPARCKNTGLAMWGEFDVNDATCTPPSWGRWGAFKEDHCTDVGKRQYSAILHDISAGIKWETACSQSPADIKGKHYYAPARCVNNAGLAMWGQFDVDDASCNAQYWGAFRKDHCTDSGKRQYSAILHNIPAGVSWEKACASTPASIEGVNFPRPARCKNKTLNMWGEFEVTDPMCNQVTECTNPALPPETFAKTGNDGTLSCDAYCANMGGNWGSPGSCVKGSIVSGMNEGTCLKCTEVGRDMGATGVTCHCKSQLTGIADTHNHQFANLSFGGKAFWGKPFGPIEEALPHCTSSHGPAGLGDLIFGLIAGSNFGHRVGGYPEFDGWPRFTSISHQAVYEDWLLRAYQGGLRLMVMLAVNSEQACGLVAKAPGRTCDDAEAIRLQIENAKEMERYIDGKYGGPGRGWYRIVYTPMQARNVIASGKLAVVLGVEVDFFLNCRTEGDCNRDDVRIRLDKYYRMGLRHIFPVHFVSNGFGSVALQNGLTHGESRFCGSEGYEYRRDKLKPTICGASGLTPVGKFLMKELIRRKMIIDIDHMSALAKDDALKIAERHKYPVIAGHTGFFDVSKDDGRHEGNLKANEVKRIRDLGGMVSVIMSPGNLDTIVTHRAEGQPVIEHQCGLTSQTFAQAYLYAVEKMRGGSVGIGTDFNGGIHLPGPRFGPDACPGGGPKAEQTSMVHYPFPVSVKGSPSGLDKSVVGNKTFDINVDGMAHIGMLPDFIEDMKQQGLRPEDLEPLLNSAEGYIKMWEKIIASGR